MQDLTSEQIREVVDYVGEHRASDEPFEVLHRGFTSGEDRALDLEIVAAYAEAGATWWLENIHPWRFGREGEGAWPLETIREYVMSGPPTE